MTTADNFMALEPLLLARLTEQLADLSPHVHVLAAVDLSGVTEDTQPTPAVHLVYQGYRVVESGSSTGLMARVEQSWLATVATRNVRQLKSGQAARADAGAIARRVARALMGFKPAGSSKPLRLADAPQAGFTAGFMYLPLAFVAELALTP